MTEKTKIEKLEAALNGEKFEYYLSRYTDEVLNRYKEIEEAARAHLQTLKSGVIPHDKSAALEDFDKMMSGEYPGILLETEQTIRAALSEGGETKGYDKFVEMLEREPQYKPRLAALLRITTPPVDGDTGVWTKEMKSACMKDAAQVCKLTEALQNIVKHCKVSNPNGYDLMATYRIATQALGNSASGERG